MKMDSRQSSLFPLRVAQEPKVSVSEKQWELPIVSQLFR